MIPPKSDDIQSMSKFEKLLVVSILPIVALFLYTVIHITGIFDSPSTVMKNTTAQQTSGAAQETPATSQTKQKISHPIDKDIENLRKNIQEFKKENDKLEAKVKQLSEESKKSMEISDLIIAEGRRQIETLSAENSSNHVAGTNMPDASDKKSVEKIRKYIRSIIAPPSKNTQTQPASK